jgi:molecular chaperone GrpE (heat shock protein)
VPTVAVTSTPATTDTVVVVNRSRDEEIAALKEQLAKSKEELAKVSEELERIKKRLANP